MSDYLPVLAKSPVFYDHYERKSDLQRQTHYCPGCGHGIVHKLIAETIADLGLQDRTVLVTPVGCSVFAYYYFNVGNIQAAHGRAPAVATAVKRCSPESIVLSYQGDGDLAAIGSAEILGAANRGEKISVIFVNNGIYGMTGGQMAPTTLLGQTTTTTPWGRNPATEGYPLHMCELLSVLQAPAFIERVALNDNRNIMRARKAVRKALELQRDNAGFAFVEILSPCPTIWKMTPKDARDWVGAKMIPVFPLGVFRDRQPSAPSNGHPPHRTVAELFGLTVHEDTPPVLKERVGFETLTVKVAGFGGQGVLLLGQILAEMGMREGLQVSWLPSYGPEMRSGSAHCHISLSTQRIGSPVVEHPDVLIAMNEISLRKFAAQVAPNGLILYNGDSVPVDFEAPQARIVCVPAADMADKLGAAKVANVVMLGTLLQETSALPAETAGAVLRDMVHSAALLEIDNRALDAGRSFQGSRRI